MVGEISDSTCPQCVAMVMDSQDAALRERLTRPLALTLAAEWYAAHGIAVFPLRVGDKRPATRHGFLDATTDAEQVAAWWAENPAANIGLPTGLRFDVIDVDPPDGWASLAELRGLDFVPATIGYAVTPRGGAHLYVAPTGAGNTTAIRPGIDYRGAGGYVVAPPSRHVNGGLWLWSTSLELS